MLIPIQVNRKPDFGKPVFDTKAMEDKIEIVRMEMQLRTDILLSRIQTLEENTLLNRFIRWSKYG